MQIANIEIERQMNKFNKTSQQVSASERSDVITRGSHDFVTKKDRLKTAATYFTQSPEVFKSPMA